jgi:predicted nuclease of predicted toxin-antitoxin system
MKFWIDAELPPALAVWLSNQYAVEAVSLRELGLRDAADELIFRMARSEHPVSMVMISKDSDFVEMVSRHGPPPQLLWVTCGNVSNRRLQEVFAKTLPEALFLLKAGQSIVEIG